MFTTPPTVPEKSLPDIEETSTAAPETPESPKTALPEKVAEASSDNNEKRTRSFLPIIAAAFSLLLLAAVIGGPTAAVVLRKQRNADIDDGK